MTHFAPTKCPVSWSKSSGASRSAPHGVATLKVRQGAFDALNKGSGELGKRSKVVTPSGAPLKNSMTKSQFAK